MQPVLTPNLPSVIEVIRNRIEEVMLWGSNLQYPGLKDIVYSMKMQLSGIFPG